MINCVLLTRNKFGFYSDHIITSNTDKIYLINIPFKSHDLRPPWLEGLNRYNICNHTISPNEFCITFCNSTSPKNLSKTNVTEIICNLTQCWFLTIKAFNDFLSYLCQKRWFDHQELATIFYKSPCCVSAQHYHIENIL